MFKNLLLTAVVLSAQSVEPFIEKTYNYINGENNVSITLKENNVCNLSGFFQGKEITIDCDYILEENILTLTIDGQESPFKVVINEDGTFEPYLEPLPKVYFIDIEDSKGGLIEFDVRRAGELVLDDNYQFGDIVEIRTTAQPFYKILENSLVVSVNDKIISTTHTVDSALWTFELKEEGTYKIKGTFDIDNETYKKFVDIFEDASKGRWDKVFSLENIMFFLSIIVMITLFIVNLVNKDKGLNKLGDRMMKKFGWTETTKPETIVTDIINECITPLINDIKNGEDLNRKTIQILTQAILYMQENTPEAKQEIVKMIGKQAYLEEDSQLVAKEVAKQLEEQQKQEQQKQEEVNKKFDQIKDTVETEEKKIETKEEEVDYRPVD